MTAWKARQKQLSPEEALANAKKEAAPFWLGSAPLMAIYPLGGKFQIFPLEPAVEKQTWLIAVRDLTHAAGNTTIPILKELHKRYSEFGVSVLLVIKTPFSFLREKEIVENMLRKHKLHFPVVLDPAGRFAQALGGDPSLAQWTSIYFNRQAWAPSDLKQWPLEVDKKLQEFLRAGDPGLPLPPLYDSPPSSIQELARITFGKGAPTPPLDYELVGVWWCEGDRIVSADAKAAIRFFAPGSRVSIVAQSASRAAFSTRCTLDLDGVPAATTFLGEDVGADESGSPALKLDEPKLYQALVGVPSKLRDTTLKFPTADRSPVQLYGICFWE